MRGLSNVRRRLGKASFASPARELLSLPLPFGLRFPHDSGGKKEAGDSECVRERTRERKQQGAGEEFTHSVGGERVPRVRSPTTSFSSVRACKRVRLAKSPKNADPFPVKVVTFN